MSPVTTPELKLSEAIRAGLKHPDYKKQVRAVFCNGEGAYCATGIAMLGYGLTPDEIGELQSRLDGDQVGDLEPIDVLPEQFQMKPPEGLSQGPAYNAIGSWIIYRNDGAIDTPEEIADQLAEVGL